MRNPLYRWGGLLLAPLFLLACGGGNGDNLCGNGVVDAGEACDDANQNENDGCNSQCQAVPENCNDLVDNDGDALVDCQDPDCAQNAACQGLEICDNGIDDDGNGVIDCADFDCINDPVCQAPDCNSPEVVDENSVTAGNNLNAPDNQAGSCDTGTGGSEVVFSVTPSVTGAMNVSMDSAADFLIYARSDCNNAGSELACADNQGGGVTESFDLVVTANQQIFIIVDAFNGAVGDFTLTLETRAAEPEICDDNIDNDVDGLVDCFDLADCELDPACEGTLDFIDFGPVTLGQVLTFDVPADAEGFTVLIEGDPNRLFAVSRLVNPNGAVIIDNLNSASVITSVGQEKISQVMPANDLAANEVIPGTWEVAVASDVNNNTPNVKVLIRRGPFAGGLMDLKIYLPEGLLACPDVGCNNGNGALINAANAAGFLEIQGMLATFFNEFYGDEGGFSQGNVTFIDIPDNSFRFIDSQAELDDLNRQSALGGPGGLHFFMVQAFQGQFPPGVAGIASGIPGAITAVGAPTAGVAVQIQGDTDQVTNFTGLTMAHEGPHFLGLFHTTEFNGSPDLVTDTPECPAGTIGGNINNCPDIVFMMFPALAPQMQQISNGQLLPLRGGPSFE